MGGGFKRLIERFGSAERPVGGWDLAQARMLKEIEQDVAYTRHQIGKTALSPAVMSAIKQVPRHEFVHPDFLQQAYINSPLPIGEGQTISQPYIVALMTDLLEPQADDHILEVGTGSGYQAAVLAHLVNRVYSLEILKSLSRQAQETLERLGYTNVECRCGNGYFGWPEKAPFHCSRSKRRTISALRNSPCLPPSTRPPLVRWFQPLNHRSMTRIGSG